MEKRNIREISQMDSLALTAIIDYWKDYDTNSVLLSYAELMRRNFSISEKLMKKQNEFIAKHDYTNINDFINLQLKEKGFNSYEEYLNNELVTIKKEELQNLDKKINPANIIEAGKALKIIVYVIVIMIFIALAAITISSQSKDIQTIKNTYIFLGILSLACNVIVLLKLHSAGDNLEKSVLENN